MRNSNQILHGDQTALENNFYTVDHATCPGQFFLIRILTHDLFAIANFLVLLRQTATYTHART